MKPVFLVPSPNVGYDLLTKNAMALVNQNAALMIKDNEAKEKLVDTALSLIQDDARLVSLSENIHKMAHFHSAEQIVDEIVRIIERK